MATQHILGPVYLIDSPQHGESGVLGTYLVKGAESVLIDPGPSSAFPGVLEGLRGLGVRDLRYVALTHVHLDHGGGAWRAAQAFPDAEVLVHPRGIEHVVDPGKLVEAARLLLGDRAGLYGEVRGVSPMRVAEAKEGEMELGGIRLRVIFTPGHSTHSMSFWEPENRILIVGDACGAFNKRTGLTSPVSPPPFNPVKAVESLDRLIALRPEIVCYGHFGFSYDAVKRLTFYREQVSLWNRVLTQCVKEGLNLSQSYGRLLEEDPVLRLAQEGQEGRSQEPRLSVLGFLEYAKWALKGEEK